MIPIEPDHGAGIDGAMVRAWCNLTAMMLTGKFVWDLIAGREVGGWEFIGAGIIALTGLIVGHK